MKLPKELLIKGKRWKVEYKWNLRNDKGEKLMGECDYGEKIIVIDRLLSPEDKFKVFLHEVLHAANDESHLHEAGGFESELLEEASIETAIDIFTTLFTLRFKRGK